MTTVKESGSRELREEIAALEEEIAALKRRVGGMEDRLGRLELREELWQEPDAAGDEPVEL